MCHFNRTDQHRHECDTFRYVYYRIICVQNYKNRVKLNITRKK